MAKPSISLKLTPENGKISGNGVYRTDGRFAGWQSPTVKVFWDLELANSGKLEIAFFMGNISQEAGTGFEITHKASTKKTTIRGISFNSGGYFQPHLMPMGVIKVDAAGKSKLIIQAVDIKSHVAGDLYHVLLTGPAAVGAKVVDVYPLKADSVHLRPDQSSNALMYYNDVVVVDSFPATYFCACGFDGGYFGIQELDFEGNKIAIFSLWDVVDTEKVADCKKSELADCSKIGDGVTLQKFGGEGTGFKTTYPYQWKLGKNVHFLLKVEPIENEYVSYSAFIYLPNKKQWKLMATLKRVTKSKHLSGYYTFIEDWLGKWGHVAREASFNPWVRTTDGKWNHTKKVHFTRAGDTDADNINGWEREGRFYMRTGGGTINTVKSLKNVIQRDQSDEIPEVLKDIDDIIKFGKFLP